jgi:hypothetical protein
MCSPEIFATISLAFVGPKILRSAYCEFECGEFRTHLATPLYVTELLRHVQKNALNLASVHGSHSDFIEAILTAYASINTASPLTKGRTNSKYFKAFTEKHSAISLSFSLSQAVAAAPEDNEKGIPFRPVTPIFQTSLLTQLFVRRLDPPKAAGSPPCYHFIER